jgi:hypothetical protein
MVEQKWMRDANFKLRQPLPLEKELASQCIKVSVSVSSLIQEILMESHIRGFKEFKTRQSSSEAEMQNNEVECM